MTSITSALTPCASLSKRKLIWLPLAFSVLLLTLLAGPTSAAPLPTFPDPNLQACFDEQAAAQGWVNAEDVRELVCVVRGIRDLYGIEQLPLLESLDLSGNLIEDLFPLNLSGGISLPNLVLLRLGDNRIRNVDPLQGYTGLQTLWLSGNAGIDFVQLRPIIEQNPAITRLGLGAIDFQEPALPWFNINRAAVVELDVSNTGIEGLWGIEEYTALQVLKASDNRIADINPLGAAPLFDSLRELRLDNNVIIDVSALANYRTLQTLWLSGNAGIDFLQLRPIIDQNPSITRLGLGAIDFREPALPWFNINRAGVIELDVSNTGIEGLWGIEEYTALQVLDASDNRIVDINPLGTPPLFDSVRELRLDNNAIVDVSALTPYHALHTLWLSGNAGIDFIQLRPIIEQNPAITRLGLGDIDVREPGLPWFNINRAGVIELDVSNTGIEGLWGIEEYTALQALEASDNRIADINPLGAAPLFDSLRELRLDNNAIVDVSALANYRTLQTLWLSGNAGIDFLQLRPIIEQNPAITRLGLGAIDFQEPALPWFNINRAAVVELDVSNTGIEGLWGIEEYTALQVLKASDNRIADINPLGAAPLFDGLRELRLDNNVIIDVSALANYRTLQTLWLSGNAGIDFLQLRPIIEQNPAITRLGLGAIDFQEPALPWFNINRAAVVELDVSNTGIEGLWGIEEYTALQVLKASDNRIADINPLGAAPLFDSLRELRLDNNVIIDVSALANYRTLQTLWLSGNAGIDFLQLRPIIDQNPSITRLGLGAIDFREPALPWFNINRAGVIELDVSNTGIEGLWGIEEYTALQVLDASDNRIVDINPLGTPPLFDSVRELRLDNNAIVDVSALTPYHALHTLWLSGNAGIDFIQLRPIIEQNPAITRLGLGDIDVREPGLPWFNINRAGVIELDVSNTGIEGLWGIEEYTALQALKASDNRIADIYPLFNLLALEFVDLRGNTGIPCDQLDQLEQILGLRSSAVLRPATCVVGQAPNVTIDQPFGGFAIIEGQPAILSANAFDTEDGDIGASIQWSSDLHGMLGTGAFLEIPLLPGDQTLSATVTDSDGNTASHSVNISVLFNNAPNVEIHSPPNGISIIEGDQLVLDGYAFDGEDGDLTAAIQWSSNIDETLGSGSGLIVTLTPGEHTLTASATDQWGKTTEATTTVTVVANASPTVTITTPAGDVAVIEGVPLMLLGNAYDDEDGALAYAIQWSSDIDGALGTGASLEVTLSVGTHQLSARVIDSRGKSGVASRQVTVVFNNPPQLSLASPNDGLQIEQYLPLALSAVASDVEDGDLSTDIAWTSDVSGSLGTGGALAVTLPLGTHVITASITDGNGKMTSITRNVTVIAPLVAEYCHAGGTTSSLWIESVSVAGITNTSGSQGGYADFTGLGPIYLDRASNAIDLVPGFSRHNRNVHWSVWIDLNRDGAFTDNERLFTAESEIMVSGSVTIPAVADAGLTRMRVMMTRRDNGEPCQDSRASEVEDYTVVLLP